MKKKLLNMQKKNKEGRINMGVAEVLTMIFAIAKILGKLDFTWFQVFLPMIVVYGFIVFIYLVIGIFTIIKCVK